MTSGASRRAERLMRWSLAPWERSAVLGDLEEERREIEERSGNSAARRWYWRQVIRSLWPNLVRRLRGDERRLAQVKGTSYFFVFGALYLEMARSGEDSSTYRWTMGVLMMGAGLSGVLSAILRRRLTPSRAERRAVFVFLALLVAASAAALHAPWPDGVADYWVVGWLDGALVLLFLALRPALPQDPPPAELLVGLRSEDGRVVSHGVATIAVPNEPLGVSGLILGTGAQPKLEFAHLLPVQGAMIRRDFTPAESVRVSAVLALPRGAVEATLGLAAADGTVVRSSAVPVGKHLLVEVPKTWDDVAFRDPAEHFGHVDAVLNLAGVAPGDYRIRLTVSDGRRSAIREEAITVRTGSSRAAPPVA